MLAPNTILRERYRIIHQLGQGGMGAVYQAMDENLSCVVAVKETFATTDEQRRAFRREAYPGGRLPRNLPGGDLRVIRGGSYDSDLNTATTTYRRGYPARGNYDYSKTGFRCAKDVN